MKPCPMCGTLRSCGGCQRRIAAEIPPPVWRPEWKKVWIVVDIEEGSQVHVDEAQADHDVVGFTESNGGTPALKVGPFELQPSPRRKKKRGDDD